MGFNIDWLSQYFLGVHLYSGLNPHTSYGFQLSMADSHFNRGFQQFHGLYRTFILGCTFVRARIKYVGFKLIVAHTIGSQFYIGVQFMCGSSVSSVISIIGSIICICPMCSIGYGFVTGRPSISLEICQK